MQFNNEVENKKGKSTNLRKLLQSQIFSFFKCKFKDKLELARLSLINIQV